MKLRTTIEYLSAGGNRHPSAGDIHQASGLICYGSGRNLVIWSPSVSSTQSRSGIIHITNAHQDAVNAVRFWPNHSTDLPMILSGSADKTLRVWQSSTSRIEDLTCIDTVQKHTGSINCLAVSERLNIIASGSTDGTVKIWRIRTEHPKTILELQTIVLRSKYYPLAISLHPIDAGNVAALAVGGTQKTIDIYVSKWSDQGLDFVRQTSLAGHDGWIRSLDFVHTSQTSDSDILLASASQDKYIRLWRIHKEESRQSASQEMQQFEGLTILSNRTHRLQVDMDTFTITFEALLLGHEDWVYSVRWSWNQNPAHLMLLSASADNSLVIWESEPSSGIWICKDRLGEVSVQKGSTTATGSIGGFWIGLWGSNGRSIAGLGRTGSWRRWSSLDATGKWVTVEAVTGHSKDVRDLAWSRTGRYLLSTSADQTTRIHASNKTSSKTSWCELARPQIHGYDLNCVEAIGDWQFVSGADEKLLRVFDATTPFATSLQALSGVQLLHNHTMPQVATVPVLGLSNKEVLQQPDGQSVFDSSILYYESSNQLTEGNSNRDHGYPPSEDILSRHTLWPEHEKLYGHGFEVSALATSHDGSIIASACKASSPEHAVIRLYDTRTWLEVKPALEAHSLTVTCLEFSESDHYLISGGRDRQWCFFERTDPNAPSFMLKASNPKGHSRMILGISWISSCPELTFATAGRDKCIKFWIRDNAGFTCCSTIPAVAPVTSIHFCSLEDRQILFGACGLETGGVLVHVLNPATLDVINTLELGKSISPSLSVSRVKWQPGGSVEVNDTTKFLASKRLAIASQDNSVRIVRVTVL